MEIHKAIVKLCSLCEDVGRCSECIDKMYEQGYNTEDIKAKEIEFSKVAHECDDLRKEIEEACPNKIELKRERQAS